MWEDIKSPVIIAHRGASDLAPENSIAAFQLAEELNASAIEFDVMLSADQIPVIIHDHTVDRTTDGKGLVSKLTKSELTSLDAGSSFHPDFKNSRIPLLSEVLSKFESRMLLNIELKNQHSPFDELPEIVYREVKSTGYPENILFSSFNPIALIRIKQIDPSVQIALLCDHSGFGKILRSPAGYLLYNYSLHPSWKDTDQLLVQRLNSRSRKVIPYTVNDQRLAKNLLDLGVFGIITNNPGILGDR